MANTSLIAKIDDFINPIAVKEIRQAVKGNLIIWILMLFMVVQLLIIGGVLVFSDSVGVDFNMGRDIFMALLGVLLGTCMLFLPAIATLRMASERSDKNVDLLFITTLKPSEIIWGKLCVSIILTLLFFSATMPLMTLTYLLRGLDLPSMFILLGLDFLVVAGGVQLGLMLASFPGSLIGRGIYFLLGFGALFVMFMTMCQVSYGIMYYGGGEGFSSWEFWAPALTIVALILAAIGLMFVLSVACVSPKSSNRAFLPRIYIFALWILTGALAIFWAIKESERDILAEWMIGATIFFCLKLFVNICERNSYGPRLRKSIPQNKLLRIPAFLFHSGVAGGISYTITMMALTNIIALLVIKKHFSLPSTAFYIQIGFATYALSYCLLGFMVKKTFFANSQKEGLPAIITVFLCAAGIVIPAVIGFLVKNNPNSFVDDIWFVGSPFVFCFEKDLIPGGIHYSAIFAAILMVILLPWFIGRIKDFKPLTTLAVNCEDEAGDE